MEKQEETTVYFALMTGYTTRLQKNMDKIREYLKNEKVVGSEKSELIYVHDPLAEMREGKLPPTKIMPGEEQTEKIIQNVLNTKLDYNLGPVVFRSKYNAQIDLNKTSDMLNYTLTDLVFFVQMLNEEFNFCNGVDMQSSGDYKILESEIGQIIVCEFDTESG